MTQLRVTGFKIYQLFERVILKSSNELCLRFLVAGLLCVVQTGCVQGLFFHDVTTPFTTNMHSTPFVDIRDADNLESAPLRTASATTIREPFSVIGLSATWSSYGFGKALRDERTSSKFSGSICSADLRVQSILFGVWRRDTIRVNECAGVISP